MYKIVVFATFLTVFLNFVAAGPSKYTPPIIRNVVGEEIIVNATNNLTLLCEGKEEITWTYPNNTFEGTYWSIVHVTTSQSNGKYFAKLSITNASFVDVDYYYCHAQDSAKDDPQRSVKTYVYVRDDNHLSVKPTEEIEFLTAVQYSTVILPCRPTSPDVTMSLFDINGEEVQSATFKNNVGFEVKMNAFDAHFECKFQRDGKEEDLTIFVTVIIAVTDYVAKPYIEAPSNGRTKVGSTYTLNCTVTVDQNMYFTLNWATPNPAAEKSGRINSTVATAIEVQGHKQGSSSLTIHNVQKEDAGEYTCIIIDHRQKNNSVSKIISVFGQNESYLNIIKEETEMSTLNVTSGTPSVQWVVLVDTFPAAIPIWYNNKEEKITTSAKYEILFDDITHKATLKIKQVALNDTGMYKIVVNNSHEEKILNFTLNVYATPTVHIESV